MIKLTEEQIAVYLKNLPLWHYSNQALTKRFECSSFGHAVKFVNRIAVLAEQADHHPELLIEFNKVTVTLSTHDSHGVTGKDFSLAQQIQELEESPVT